MSDTAVPEHRTDDLEHDVPERERVTPDPSLPPPPPGDTRWEDRTADEDTSYRYSDADAYDQTRLQEPSDSVVVRDQPERTKMIERDTLWSPSQIAPLAGGVVLIIFGLAAIIKGGLGGAVDAPVVSVFGYAHTPLLGLIELGAGILFVIAGLVPYGRTPGIVLGVLTAIGGGLILADLNWVNRHLTTDSDFGWILIAIGGGVAVLLAVLPRVKTHTVEYRPIT
jgi:hypothetical protein